jgi:hypothetical protein
MYSSEIENQPALCLRACKKLMIKLYNQINQVLLKISGIH